MYAPSGGRGFPAEGRWCRTNGTALEPQGQSFANWGSIGSPRASPERFLTMHMSEWVHRLRRPRGRLVWIGAGCVLAVLLIWLQRDAAFRSEQADLLLLGEGAGVHPRQWIAKAMVWAQARPRVRYVAPATLAFLVTAALACVPYWRGATRPWVRSPRLFDGILLIAIASLRWPTLAATEMNPDESEHITQALKLLVSPLPWISIDQMTDGPLTAAALLPPVLLRMPVDYGAAKLMHLIGTWANVALLHRALRRIYGDLPARWAVFPALFALGLAQDREFVAYNAEVPTTFLLSLGLYLLVRLATLAAVNLPSAYFAGFALGLTPFAKAQGVPAALVLAVGGAIVLVYRMRGEALASLVRPLAVFVLGGFTVTILVFVYLLVAGGFENFWNSYALTNWEYVNRNPDVGIGAYAVEMYKAFAGFPSLYLFWWRNVELGVAGILLLPMAAAVRAYLKRRDAQRGAAPLNGTPGTIVPRPWPQVGLATLAAAFFIVSMYSVSAPRNPYFHYMWFMMIPLALLGASWIGTMLFAFRSRLAVAAGLLVFVLYSGSQLAWHVATNARGSLLSGHPEMVAGDDISRRLLQLVRPGHPVAIWGWMCRYFVYTGTYSATRQDNSVRAIEEHLQPYYRSVYLEDLRKNRPEVFVDAVARGAFWFNQSYHQHEVFPELAAWVAANYRQVDNIRGTRIYVREEKPRAPE